MEVRELERKAANNDPEAIARLSRIRARAGQGRHGDKIGQWITIDGVRDHYRGKLLNVTEMGGGVAILNLAPCYWLQSLEGPEGERKIRATEENPFDLCSYVVGGVALQPEDWPKE